MRTNLLCMIACTSSMVIFAPIVTQGQIWTIVTAAQDTVTSCSIGALTGQMVTFNCGDSILHIPEDSLQSLSRQSQSTFWSYAGIGVLAGSAVGAIVGPSFSFGFRDEGSSVLGGAVLGATAGFAIGGLFSFTASDVDIYDLASETTESRLAILRGLRKMQIQ